MISPEITPKEKAISQYYSGLFREKFRTMNTEDIKNYIEKELIISESGRMSSRHESLIYEAALQIENEMRLDELLSFTRGC